MCLLTFETEVKNSVLTVCFLSWKTFGKKFFDNLRLNHFIKLVKLQIVQKLNIWDEKLIKTIKNLTGRDGFGLRLLKAIKNLQRKVAG